MRDPNITKSAASLSVKVGSATSHDPRTRLGLALFVERMMLMGKTYPDENEYK